MIASAIGLSSSSVSADPVPENFPPCRLYRLDSGLEICGFTDLEDWKLVLKVDRELTFLRLTAKIDEKRADNLSLQVATLEGQVAALEKSQVIFADRNEELTRQLIACDKSLQDERVKPAWGSTLAWTFAGISTSVLVGVIAGLLL